MNASPASLGALLTRRLAVIALALALVNLAAVALRYAGMPEELARSALHRALAELEEGLPAAPATPRIAGAARADYDAHPHAYAFALLDAAGRRLDGANPALLAAALPTTSTGALVADATATELAIDAVTVRDGTPLHASVRDVGHGATRLRLVVVMADDPARWSARALLGELVSHVALPMVPVIVLLLGANAALVRRAMAPVVAAAGWARALRPGARQPAPAPDAPMPEEIDALVRAIERAMARLDDALSAERRRSAEAAHALRTPLAVLAARIDALPADATGDALRRDVRMLARTVHQLLAAATADTAAAPGADCLDLAASAGLVAAQLAPFAHARGADLELVVHPGGARARADAGAVEVALVNLVENAVLHGGGAVTIEAGPGPVLQVRDRGPGLPADPAPLFEPFRRGPDAAPGGAGLGLAIVRRVMDAQEGTVEAWTDPAGGAAFALRFQPPAD